MPTRRLVVWPLLLLAAAAPAPAAPLAISPAAQALSTPFDRCDAAIAAVRSRGRPPDLLPSIARVESGRLDPATGRVRPWPWTINVDGVGRFFATVEDAAAAVRALQARGKRSIDVGCMQVNLYFHPGAFPTVEAGFDPAANVAYAARFLQALHARTRDWALATALYHSEVQERGEDYQRQVFGRVVTPMRPAAAAMGAYAAFLPRSAIYAALPPASLAFGAFPQPGRAQPGWPQPGWPQPGWQQPGPPLLRRAAAQATARR